MLSVQYETRKHISIVNTPDTRGKGQLKGDTSCVIGDIARARSTLCTWIYSRKNTPQSRGGETSERYLLRCCRNVCSDTKKKQCHTPCAPVPVSSTGPRFSTTSLSTPFGSDRQSHLLTSGPAAGRRGSPSLACGRAARGGEPHKEFQDHGTSKRHLQERSNTHKLVAKLHARTSADDARYRCWEGCFSQSNHPSHSTPGHSLDRLTIADAT